MLRPREWNCDSTPLTGLHGMHTDNFISHQNITTKCTTQCTDTEPFMKGATNYLMYVVNHQSTGKMSPHALFPEWLGWSHMAFGVETALPCNACWPISSHYTIINLLKTKWSLYFFYKQLYFFQGCTSFIHDLEFMIQEKVHAWWKLSWKFTTPSILVVSNTTSCFVSCITNYKIMNFLQVL